MKKSVVFPRIMTITGAILVWLPILLPLLIFATKGQHNLDYLMPVELFFVSFAGGVLLFLAAVWVRFRVRIIGWGLGISILLRIGIEVLGYFRGLYSGEGDIEIWNDVIMTVVALYSVPVIVMGIGGILLWIDMFKRVGKRL